MSRRFARAVIRLRYLIVLCFVALCAYLVPATAQLEHDDDVFAFLPPDRPEVRAFEGMAQRFGITDVALVGLGASNGDLFAPDAVDRLRRLSQRVAEVPGVEAALSFPDMPHPQANESGLEVTPLVPENMLDPARIRERVLSSQDAVGSVISKDGKAAALLIFLSRRSADGIGSRTQTLAAIEGVVDEAWSGERHFAGGPFVERGAAEMSRRDIERLSPLVIAVLAIACALLLRSWMAALLNLALAGSGVGLLLGAHARLGEALTIVSSSLPVMMIALGGAFGVHVIAGYLRQRGTATERAEATLVELAGPVALSGLTTSVAFFALTVMPQAPMQRFGIAAGLGMLLLLQLALVVLPAGLALLPTSLLPPKRAGDGWKVPQAPAWAMVITAGIGLVGTLQLRPEADMSQVFAENSAPRRADRFFQTHFGGSTYLQIGVEADLNDAEVLRRLRDLKLELAGVEGVVGVRSITDAVATVNAGIGGREGVPEDSKRARRVMTFLVGHPALAQLMTEEADGALLHVKLQGRDSHALQETTKAVEAIVARQNPQSGRLLIAATTHPSVAAKQRADVERALGLTLGRPVALDPRSDATRMPSAISPALRAEIIKLRDQVFDHEEGAVEVALPSLEIESLAPEQLLVSEAELERLFRAQLPTLVAQDPEGLGFAAEHLHAWIKDARKSFAVDEQCAALELEAECPQAKPILAELRDSSWAVSPDLASSLDGVVEQPLSMEVNGQPILGRAFGESVTRSLWLSTLVSVVALALVLALSRQLFALIPALWTLVITGGLTAVMGHPISVGTSMIACIALGAGVDFAIHLGVRARRLGQVERAVKDLGPVILISSVELGAAFLVLLGSEMLPLQHFGSGLALGLVGAAFGALWLTPAFLRRHASGIAQSRL